MGGAYFRRVPSRVVEALIADPTHVRKVLFPSSTETVVDDDVLVSIETWEELDLALGGAHPLDFIAAGGTPLGGEDIGSGPARGFTAAQVRKIAGTLGPFSPGGMPDAVRADYNIVRDFIMTTAKAEAGMIAFIDSAS